MAGYRVGMNLTFREGAEVLSSDGTKLGHVERLVVDPARGEVTHVTVSKGVFFPDERVVPVDIVSGADQDMVHLAAAIEPRDLPRFEEVHYVEVDDETTTRRYPDATSRPLIWSYPTYAALPTAGYPLYPMYPVGKVPSVERNVPPDAMVVRTGSTVVSSDGENVGKVREATIGEDGALVSIEVDPGWFRSERSIPAHFVHVVEEDRVKLAVAASTLEQFDR